MATISQRSFAGGEISPSLYARVDTVKYTTGLRTFRNMFVMKHGGAANRSGTEFIGEVKDSSKTVRLIPFVFNADQTYVLEFGDLYMRVIKDGSYQSDLSLTITGITNANPAVLTYTGTDPTNGEEVYISGVVGNMASFINNRNFKIANVNAGLNTLELKYMNGTNVNSTAFGTYTSGGTAARVYTITSPYAEADLSTLNFVQSADVITIVHRSYAPYELARTGDTSWTLTAITFAPGISAPTALTNTTDGNGSTIAWVVTAVSSSGEESLPSSQDTGTTVASPAHPVHLTWTAVSGAAEYTVYSSLRNDVFGFRGIASTNAFEDVGSDNIDLTDTPPAPRNPFGSSDNYPGVVSYIQQRLVFASTNNDPETVFCSRTGFFKNFTTSRPTQDDDAVTFTLVGRQVNQVRSILDLGRPVALTAAGEWSFNGNSSGVLTPSAINAKQQGYSGASPLQPIVIGSSAVYVQARGSIVKDLVFDFNIDGYKGNDLTIFSSHLVENNEIDDWTFQQIPHSIVWAVRDDGVLLGMTYVREHELVGWHRHDFDGTVENVCAVPEGLEDALYLTIKRTINGATVRYVERMHTRQIEDIIDYVGVDSSLSYDGRNTNSSHTMTLSGGTTWVYTETLTLTSSASFFTAADVGNAIHLTGSDGTIIRFTIVGFTNVTTVTGHPHATVPAGMRAISVSDWTRAVDQITGLWHLEGEDLSIFADAFVVGSPNNESYDTLTVANGSIILPRPFGVIHAGLPVTSDIETLDIDFPQGETLADKKKIITRVNMYVQDSRGMWMGGEPPSDDDIDPLEGLTELKIRNDEAYNDPIILATEVIDVNIKSNWNSNGRVFVRQVDPVPLTILAIHPAGLIPIRG